MNTKAVIVRLLCSKRVRKREGEMEGWRGWKELWEGGQACVHMCKRVKEKEREHNVQYSEHLDIVPGGRRTIKSTIQKKLLTRGLNNKGVCSFSALMWSADCACKSESSPWMWALVEDELSVAVHGGILRGWSAAAAFSHWREDLAHKEESCLRLSLSLSFLSQSHRDWQHPSAPSLKTEDKKIKITEEKDRIIKAGSNHGKSEARTKRVENRFSSQVLVFVVFRG